MDREEFQYESLLGLCDFCQTLANELSRHPSTWDHEISYKYDESRWDRVNREYSSGTTVLNLLETAGSC